MNTDKLLFNFDLAARELADNLRGWKLNKEQADVILERLDLLNAEVKYNLKICSLEFKDDE
jgi:hypothetical protein